MSTVLPINEAEEDMEEDVDENEPDIDVVDIGGNDDNDEEVMISG